MSRRGDGYDTAAIESCFSTLQQELEPWMRFPTHAVARQTIFEYIEVVNNRQRRHSALGYMSLVAFEDQQQLYPMMA